MYRYYNATRPKQQQDEQDEQVEEFKGKTILVDLANITGNMEDFEGKQWLEMRVNARQTLGWHIAWTHDRDKDSDNPVALVQFADSSTVLLLRTHKTRHWLPTVVAKALQADSCRKVCVNFDNMERKKMENTFNFMPASVDELADLAKRKGLEDKSLRGLAERFGHKVRKDQRSHRSNWAADTLTPEQIRYAAEEVYFSFIIYEKVKALPDPLVTQMEGFEAVNHGVLELQPGWEDQGITRRHDGLYCNFCKKGPMTVPMVVERHIESKAHLKQVKERLGLTEETMPKIPDEWGAQGIVVGDGCNGMQVGEFKCHICDAKVAFENIASHLTSKKHQKNMQAPEANAGEAEEIGPEAAKQALEKHKWNLPDYVGICEEPLLVLQCSICQPPVVVQSVQSMFFHLGSDKHAKKCKQIGEPEIIYVKERQQLEDLDTGKPIVRAHHKAPKRSKAKTPGAAAAEGGEASRASSASTAASLRDVDDAMARALHPPEGWQAYMDPASGRPYYYHEATEVYQWEYPEAPQPVLEQVPEQAPAQAQRPAPAEPRYELPPGWYDLSEAEGMRYYADVENEVSRWEPPPSYVHKTWTRHVDGARVYWQRSDPTAGCIRFYEDDGDWHRVVDRKDRVYWVCHATDERFFETYPA